MTTSAKIRVLIVDDSLFMRAAIKKTLEADGLVHRDQQHVLVRGLANQSQSEQRRHADVEWSLALAHSLLLNL